MKTSDGGGGQPKKEKLGFYHAAFLLMFMFSLPLLGLGIWGLGLGIWGAVASSIKAAGPVKTYQCQPGRVLVFINQNNLCLVGEPAELR